MTMSTPAPSTRELEDLEPGTMPEADNDVGEPAAEFDSAPLADETEAVSAEDPVEAARRLVIRGFMGFGSNAHATCSATTCSPAWVRSPPVPRRRPGSRSRS